MSTETITSYPGAFVDGAEHANSGDSLPVTNPGTGEVFAEVPGGTAEDVDAAVSAAARA
jgi:aldehyde dehydrogenase (NAD+)